jgi:oligopeptide/dipeptide ABC transporter ATP-binding protein
MAMLGLGPLTDGSITFPQLSANGKRHKARFAQMIFQDAHASLSPRLKISYLLKEPYAIHSIPRADQERPEELLRLVGLPPAILERYPHELSGGQARRVVIARALAIQPKLLVADEPTAGLDVSAAASILNLLAELRERLNLTYLLITHNLAVLSNVADQIAVMYLGRIVEQGPAARILDAPAHPYTRALLAAVPRPDPRFRHSSSPLVAGDIPSLRNPPPGCQFHPRCPTAQEICTRVPPALTACGPRLVSCHFPVNV